MSKIIPPNRPKISRAEIENIIAYHKAMFPHKFSEKDFVFIVGIRGYFLDSLGKADVNDYNVYDDAIIALSPRYYKTFNANCDPSFVKHPTDGKPLAKLNLGVYPFYEGRHQNKYDAFRAYPNGVQLPCTRDGKPSVCSFINIHWGGETPSWYVTFSHGCQTIPKTQFTKEFQPEVHFELKKYGQKTVPFILIEKVMISGVEKFKAGNNQIIPENFQPEVVEKLEAVSAVDTDENSAIHLQTGDSSENAGAQNQPPIIVAETVPTQQAENITNVTTGESSSGVPDDFVPEDKTVNAPPPSGMMRKAWIWVAGLGILPPSLGTAVESIRSFSADGAFNLKDALVIGGTVFKFVFPYVVGIAVCFIVFWGIKEILKQISLIVKVYVSGRGDMNNVEIVPQTTVVSTAGPTPLYKKIFNL